MNFRWIWFIAARYIFRKKKKSPAPVLSILGIAIGVLALIVILSVMNGFQLGFIESILEISSYHLRIGPIAGGDIEELRKAALTVPGVKSAVPFREFHGLVRGKTGGQQAAVVRGLPERAMEMDSGLAGRLSYEEGSFSFNNKNDALLGAELVRRLGLRIGDEITVFSIPSIFNTAGGSDPADDSSGLRTFTVTGIFRTGFYEYDTSWMFIDIDSAAAFSETGPVLGIKLKNRFHDRQALESARKILGDNPAFAGAAFSSWRDYNRSFFGALRTEKLFMFILVGLIFIVVALNIYQAQRRSVLEHREEIGLLRAVGGGERSVQLVFILDGAIIGFSGASTGLCFGLLIASNISRFFSVIEAVVNFGINIVNIVASFFSGYTGGFGDFFFFSPAVFYIREIPSRIIPGEIVLIFFFGLLSALLAAWFASRKVARIRPAEVLRYE